MALPMHDISWISEKTWIDTTLKALEDKKISIGSSIKGLTEWSNQDTFLVEKAMNYLSGIDLNIFNKVRMYLQVATLSDIMTADGKEIDAPKLHGREDTTCPNPSKSAYIWPNVPKPQTTEIALWKDTICKMFAVTTNNRRLQGAAERKWDDRSRLHAQWNHQDSNDTIYQRKGAGWTMWRCMNTTGRTRRASQKYTRGPTTLTLPTNVRPSTIEINSPNTVILQTRGHYLQMTNHQQQQTNSLRWTLPEVHTTQQMERQYAEDIRNQTARIGSYVRGRSSAAFVTQHTQTQTPLREVDQKGNMHGQVTVPDTRMSKIRTEANLGEY